MKSQPDVETLRAVSKVAYGHTYRLELMLAILAIEDGICTLSQLAEVLQITISSLQRPFEALVELGLLSSLPVGASKFHHFIRNEGVGWEWAEHLAERAR